MQKTEENNNVQDKRFLQENKRYQGNISCKDGHNKGQKHQDLMEAEGIKKRWQEYTEELYKKDHHDPDNHDGEIIHLECEVGLRKHHYKQS